MRPPAAINVDAMTRKIAVDNRIPLRNYYRIADNLLKQASIYRSEKNIIDLYIILIRYSSLVSETIPYHRDYQVFHPKERSFYRKRLLEVIEELESLKPDFRRQLDKLNKAHAATKYGIEISTQQQPTVNKKTTLSTNDKQLVSSLPPLSWKLHNTHAQPSLPSSINVQFQKLSIGLPLPKQETLSRHSFLGPNGLRGQWHGPSSEIKVQYPAYNDLTSGENLSLIQVKESDSEIKKSSMESVLSLDDGRWSCNEESCPLVDNEVRGDQLVRQPSPPPSLAQVHPVPHQILPSRVADPRPGPAKAFQDELPGSNTYQHLHIPVKMMDDFLRLAQENTRKNLETCGVLAGSLKNRMFHITTLIIPKQESTSDSCETLNEEEIFEVQDKLSLFPLGWIHTHPSQTCFMSSIDLHTHYSYQIMLPEAIAIVMAPTDRESPFGIFHLSDPGGVTVIRNCQQRGFHPHEEPDDGSSIYEHCSHVYMNPNQKFEVMDLR